MLPEAFLDRMKYVLGGEYEDFLESYSADRVQGLCLNPGKIGIDGCSAAERFGAEAGKEVFGFAHLTKVPWAENGYYYQTSDQPGKHPYHEAGLYYIQEPSAMAPVELLTVEPGERVLDLCAAPGGKSTQIAAKLRGRGFLVCNEIHPARAKILSENIERMGIGNVLVTNETPERLADFFPAYFDCILVDAPCSGEGMFRKNGIACEEWSPENVSLCAARQDGILDCAARMLRPGGRLVYSTCTFAPEEDEGSIGRFLERQEGFRIVPVPKEEMGLAGCDGMPKAFVGLISGLKETETGLKELSPDLQGNDLQESIFSLKGQERGIQEQAFDLKGTLRLWPHRVKGEGHFAAVLRKDGTMPERYDSIVKNSMKKDVDRVMPEEFARFCSENLNLFAGISEELEEESKHSEDAFSAMVSARPEISGAEPRDRLLSSLGRAVGMGDTLRYVKFGENLYAAPCDMPSLSGLKVLRPGLHLGEMKKNRFEPSHALALALNPAYAAHVWNLNSDDPVVRAYLNGQTFPAEGEKGWYLICADGFGIGWGKLAGNIMKNHYPRGLRR